MPPLVVEVYLDVSELKPKQSLVFTDAQGSTWPGERKEIVLERWIVELRPDQKGPPTEVPILYKRFITAIRALYTLSRLLPSWTLNQRLARQKLAASPLRIGCRAFDGSHPISSKGRVGLSGRIGNSSSTPPSPQSARGPAAPHLSSYSFAPLQTPAGTLYTTISYRNEVNFGVDDADTVFAQQFLELDRPTELSIPRSRTRPVVSFTQPFRTPDASVPNTSRTRTPSTGSIARAGSVGAGFAGGNSVVSSPVPVPRAGTSGTAAGSFNSSTSSSIHRFMSSFARQSNPGRVGSLESRHSVEYRSNPVSTASTPSSLEPGSGIFVPNSGVSDFMRFVNDTQKRAGSFKGQASASSVDNSLSRYQNMRQPFTELTESLMMSSQRHISPTSVTNSALGVTQSAHSVVAQRGDASPQSTRSLSPSRGEPLFSELSPTSRRDSFPHASSAPAAVVAPVLVSVSPVAGSISQSRQSGAAANTLARYAHPPAVPSRLSEQYTGRTASSRLDSMSSAGSGSAAGVATTSAASRASSVASSGSRRASASNAPSVSPSPGAAARNRRARNRLSYYIDDDLTVGPDEEGYDDYGKEGSDDELLFAMSDMNCI